MNVFRQSLAAVLGVVTLFVAHSAPAQEQELVRPNAWTVIKPIAPAAKPAVKASPGADQTLGVALLGATMNADGSTSASSGVTSSNNFGVGGYAVVFDRDVSTCMVSAVPITNFVLIRVVILGGTQIQFNVNKISDGSFLASPFSFVVYCPK